jgi:hypothetical protein
MCLNQNVAKVDDNNTIIREVSNNLVSNSRNTNSSNTNSSNTNNTNNTNSSNTNSSNTNSSNTNSSNTNSSNTNNFNRNQNFMRESYPPYQSPLLLDSSQENKDSEFIPRPVLTDFSSFGM